MTDEKMTEVLWTDGLGGAEDKNDHFSELWACVDPNLGGVRHTVGYFVSSNEEFLTLKNDLYTKPETTETALLRIPWSSILALESFEVH